MLRVVNKIRLSRNVPLRGSEAPLIFVPHTFGLSTFCAIRDLLLVIALRLRRRFHDARA